MKKKMTRSQAMKKFVETRTLSTDLLPALGIGMETFLRFAQVSDARANDIKNKLVAAYTRELEAERLAKKAERALARGDIDEAFDYALDAANTADGLKP